MPLPVEPWSDAENGGVLQAPSRTADDAGGKDEAQVTVVTARELADEDDTESYTLFVKNLAWKTGAAQPKLAAHCWRYSTDSSAIRPLHIYIPGCNNMACDLTTLVCFKGAGADPILLRRRRFPAGPL